MESHNNLGLKEIERFQKRGIRLNESYGASLRTDEDNPLSGFALKQKNRNKNTGDVLNIGSGTRCKHCGMLYFCWVDKCRTCGRQVEFNLGKRRED
tara:strand:+ start:16495 stop:16782 length:288 start_codon:yes stop_codon:yes gene_type:complete